MTLVLVSKSSVSVSSEFGGISARLTAVSDSEVEFNNKRASESSGSLFFLEFVGTVEQGLFECLCGIELASKFCGVLWSSLKWYISLVGLFFPTFWCWSSFKLVLKFCLVPSYAVFVVQIHVEETAFLLEVFLGFLREFFGGLKFNSVLLVLKLVLLNFGTEFSGSRLNFESGFLHLVLDFLHLVSVPGSFSYGFSLVVPGCFKLPEELPNPLPTFADPAVEPPQQRSRFLRCGAYLYKGQSESRHICCTLCGWPTESGVQRVWFLLSPST